MARTTCMKRTILASPALLAALLAIVPAPAAAAHEQVSIRRVGALTLQTGRLTTGRRAAPVSQLTCRGANCWHAPSTVRCANAGWDGKDVQWDCTAELDSAVRFGRLNVQCEGYAFPDDPNILAGSCGLEYTLDSTGSGGSARRPSHGGSSDSEGSFGGLAVLVVLFCLMSSCGGGGGSSSCRSSSSSPGFWTGAAVGGMAASRYGGGRSYGGGGTHRSTGYASTSRR